MEVKERGLYLLDSGIFNSVNIKCKLNNSNWEIDTVENSKSAVNVKFMCKTGAVLIRMKFDGINYGISDSLIDNYTDLEPNEIRMYNYMRINQLKLDINSKLFREI